MSLNTTLLKVFNVNPNEGSRVILLILHSFFLGVYVSYFFSFANGIFLSKFDISYLPVAYVLSGFLGFLLSAIFSTIQRKMKYYNLLVGVMFLVLVVTFLFVLGFRFLDNTRWLVFIVFISVGPIFSLMNLSFWGLTISLFDLREGKRLFGLIGSGDVISSILGYFSIPLVIRLVGDSSNLMVIAILGLVIAVVFQLIIIRRLPEAKAAQNISKKKIKEPGLSLKEIFTNKYFRFIFLLVVFSMVSQYFVDYNFMGIARSQMQNEIELTSFIGIFFGLVKIVELLFRTLAAGRLMSKYGILLGLLLLPVMLLSFTLLALGSYFVASNFILFFLMLSMIKLIDKVIRRSMEEPAVKTLYQPVDAKTKLQLQTSVEGKGKQLAVMLAGGVLVLFNLIPNFSLVIAATISCFLIVAWMVYAYKTYNEYRVLLNKQLTTPSESLDYPHGVDNSIYFIRGIDSENEFSFERSAMAMHNMKPDLLIPLYPEWVKHPNENIRNQTLNWIKERPLLSVLNVLKDQLAVETNAENIDILNNTLQWIKGVINLSEDEIKDMIRSTDYEDRIKAAAWICHFEKQKCADLLDILLKDKESKVVKATCFYISSIKNSGFLKSLLQHFMQNKSYEHSALLTLMLHSNKAEELFNISLNEFNNEEKFILIEEANRAALNQPLVRIGLLNRLGQLDNEYAKEYLKSKLNDGNWTIQYFILENLKELGYAAPEAELMTFRQLILKETAFSTWILAAISDLKKGDNLEDLIASLEEQLAGSKIKIFNILSFLYPKEAIAKIETNLNSGQQEKEVLALEMADILLDEVHKDIVFPLFDKLSVVEKVKNLSQHFPQAMMKSGDRLKNIIFYDYSMLNNVTRAFAIQALKSKSSIVPNEVIAQIYGKDYLLKEIAYTSIHVRNENLYNEFVGKENDKFKLHLNQLSNIPREDRSNLSKLEIIHALNSLPLFNRLPFWKLTIITKFFDPLFLKANQQMNIESGYVEKIHFFLNGALHFKSLEGEDIAVKPGDLFGFFDSGLGERELEIIEDSILLSISKSDFYQILEGLPEICEILYNLYMTEDSSQDDETKTVEDLFLEYA